MRQGGGAGRVWDTKLGAAAATAVLSVSGDCTSAASHLQGRGTVITGRVEQGVVKVGDNIELVGIQGTPTTTVVTGAPAATSPASVHADCRCWQ